MNNYQQRIRERAEQFFNRFIQNAPPNLVPYDDFENSIWKDDMLNLAKLSVDAEAEAYKEAFYKAASGYGTHLKERDIKGQCEYFMIKCGLIPPPENSNKQE